MLALDAVEVSAAMLRIGIEGVEYWWVWDFGYLIWIWWIGWAKNGMDGMGGSCSWVEETRAKTTTAM